jgi:uncharacterized protein DUF927
MTRAVDKTGTPAPTVADNLARALETAFRESNGDGAKTLGILKSAGVTFRKGKERDPAFAAHAPNIADLSATFSYSAEGTPGHETCCGGRPRGLYQGDRLAARIPYIWGIATAKNGRAMITAPLMSATADGAHRAVIPWDEIKDGTWANSLNTGLTPDRQIVTAAAAAIIELAYETGVPQFSAAVTPGARTADGRIPAPVPECMPAGYWERPATDEAARLQARCAQAEIAARRPKIALTWGASVGAVFAGPLKLRQSGIWELTGEPRGGKTTTLMLGASAWGYPELPPDGMLISWDQTSKGTGRHLGELGIFPAFMDETGTADFGPDEWAKLTYSLSLGASRQTAKTRGSMGTNRTPGWQGFLFTTGNGTLTDGATAGKFAGVAARVVTLSGKFTGSAEECDQLDAAVLADYGYVGPAAIEAVTVEEFRRMYSDARDALEAPPGGIAGTIAGKLALGVAGARVIDMVLGTGTAVGDAAHLGALDYLANLDRTETDRERILRWLAESMSAERANWADERGYTQWGTVEDRQSRKLSGVYDDTWVWIYRSTWAEIAASTGVGNSATLAQIEMHDRGELSVPESRRRAGSWQTYAPRWADKTLTYKVSRAAIKSAGDSGDSGDDDDAGDSGDSANATGQRGNTGDSAAPTLTSTGDSGDSGDSANATGQRSNVATGHRGDSGDSASRGGGDSAAPTLTSTGDSGDSGDSQTTPIRGESMGWNDEPGNSIGDAINASATPPVTRPAPSYAPVTAYLKTRKTPATIGREHQAPAPADTTPEERRAAWLNATLQHPGNARYFQTPKQQNALARIIAQLDSVPDDANGTEIFKRANGLKLLAELEGHGDTWGGPFLPARKRAEPKGPAKITAWRKTGLPVCVEMAMSGGGMIEAYGHERQDYTGPAVAFDRNGAWIGSIGTVLVAHSALEHAGECDIPASSTPPGYYLVNVYPWPETDMPSPLSNAEVGTQLWVPAPIAGLLASLADAGRWPEATALDSWTGPHVRLDEWGRLIREMRRYALENHGYGSTAYQTAKDAVSISISLMHGNLDQTSARPIRVWDTAKIDRIDWRHQIITHNAAFMWRALDRCRQLADGNPSLAPLGIRSKDELWMPAAAETLVTTTAYDGGTKPPIQLDSTGIDLGTWKTKTRGEWPT